MQASRDVTLTSAGQPVTVELLERDGGELIGVGAVRVGDVLLRNGRPPIAIRVDTPEGILYTRLFVRGVEEPGGGVVRVHLRALGLDWGRQEYRDEYNLAMLSPMPGAEPVEDTVTLELAPTRLDMGGRQWVGLSYRIRFHSDTRRVHRIWTHATWEIGGSITGNTVLHQGQCNQPVYRGSAGTRFTTYCLKTLDQYGSAQGMSYQCGPRGGLLQAFDFQHTDDAALLMYWPEFGSIHSFLDSPEGCDVLRVMDEYRLGLSGDVATPAKHILVTRGPLALHEARDLWWHAHEHVYGGIRRRHGVTASVVKPEMGQNAGGGTIGTRVVDGRLRMGVAEKDVDSTEMLTAFADRVLPVFAEQGIARTFPVCAHETDVTVLGMRRKLDDGIHGDLHCASVCGSHRFFPSEFWGGINAWRYMADKARSLGIEVGAWFAPHFAPRAAIFQQHPDWLLRGPETHHWGGGYSFHTIVTADWNTGVYQWVLDDLKRWADQGGLDYLFTDSWPNLGLLPYNFAADMRTNQEALGRLYGDIQKIGIRVLSFEGISPFGLSRFGARDLRGDLLEEQGGVAGQNDLGWWIGEEDMAYGACVCTEARKRASAELEQIQFRAMANRAFVMYQNQMNEQYRLPDWWVRLNHTYAQAVPHMQTRRLLPDGLGTQWDDGTTQVVWAYRDGTVGVDAGATVSRLDGADSIPVEHDGTLNVQAGGVYRIRG